MRGMWMLWTRLMVVACLSGVVLGACQTAESPPGEATLTPDTTVSVPLNGVDACTIALAPVGDAGHAEDDITRFQEAARQAPQVLPYWERLG